jgi:cytochrome c553
LRRSINGRVCAPSGGLRRLTGAIGLGALATLALMSTVVAAQSSRPTLPERLATCQACHGADGNSRIAGIPSLAGQPAFFLMNQLFLMREGVRRVEAMGDLVKNFRDEELDAVARHFSALPAKASDEAVDAGLAERGAALATAKRCGSCHLPSLAGQEQMPRVARQRIDYLVHAMKAFRDNQRSGADTAMSAVVYGMSDADLTALAHHAATK